jgi:hypothetical protein
MLDEIMPMMQSSQKIGLIGIARRDARPKYALRRINPIAGAKANRNFVLLWRKKNNLSGKYPKPLTTTRRKISDKADVKFANNKIKEIHGIIPRITANERGIFKNDNMELWRIFISLL